MERLIDECPMPPGKLAQLMLATLKFPSPQHVLVTAAATVGDLSRRAFKHIKPMAPQLLREVCFATACVVDLYHNLAMLSGFINCVKSWNPYPPRSKPVVTGDQ